MQSTHLLWLGVDGGSKLLLRHRLALCVLLVHTSLGNGTADAAVSTLCGKDALTTCQPWQEAWAHRHGRVWRSVGGQRLRLVEKARKHLRPADALVFVERSLAEVSMAAPDRWAAVMSA